MFVLDVNVIVYLNAAQLPEAAGARVAGSCSPEWSTVPLVPSGEGRQERQRLRRGRVHSLLFVYREGCGSAFSSHGPVRSAGLRGGPSTAPEQGLPPGHPGVVEGKVGSTVNGGGSPEVISSCD